MGISPVSLYAPNMQYEGINIHLGTKNMRTTIPAIGIVRQLRWRTAAFSSIELLLTRFAGEQSVQAESLQDSAPFVSPKCR